jgi:hypothetical protein
MIINPYIGQHKTFFEYPPSIGFSFSIWREGDYPSGIYYTSYNWDALQNSIPSTNAYYVDPVSGNDANSGTIGSPLKSVKVAVEKTDRDIVYLKPGFYPYTEGLQGSNLSGVARPLRIETYGGSGRAILSTATTLTFTPNATFPATVQQASTSGSDASYSVVDLTNTETVHGETRGIKLVNVSSLALVNSTANSYWHNAVANLLYVHTFDNRTVDSNIITLRGQINGVNTGVQNIYMENVEFWGNSGAGTFSFNNNSTTQASIVAVNCWFCYSSVIDGLDIRGTVEGYFNNCVAYGNHEDGFNYTPSTSNYSPKCFEYYCTGWRNGYAISGADNNTTAHGDCKTIRVGGNYQYSANRSVHDIDNTLNFLVGCVSGNSTSSSKISFACGGSGGPNGTISYFIECSSVGAQTFDFAVYLDTIVYVNAPLMRGTITREAGSKLRQYIVPSTTIYSDEYQAYLDELTFGSLTLPSSTESAKDDTLITGLISDGEWDKIGVFKRFKQAPSIGASLISLKYPGLYKSTAVNSPTFDADGVGSNGTSSYINTNWDISLDEMFLRDNSSMGVWVSVGASLSGSTRYLMGVNTTIAIGEASGVTNVTGRLNDGTNNEFTGNANFASGSSYIIRRTSSTNLEMYVNGILVNTVSTASTAAPPSGMLGVLCRIASGTPSLYSLSTWRIGAVFTGTGSIDPLEVHNRLATRFA